MKKLVVAAVLLLGACATATVAINAGFDFCNKLADRAAPTELGLELAGNKTSFHLIHQEDWRSEFDGLLKRKT